jgi:hypothetical protein
MHAQPSAVGVHANTWHAHFWPAAGQLAGAQQRVSAKVDSEQATPFGSEATVQLHVLPRPKLEAAHFVRLAGPAAVAQLAPHCVSTQRASSTRCGSLAWSSLSRIAQPR